MLTAKQKRCVQLMVVGEYTQKQIAEQVKVSQQTICTWKKDPEFMAAYESLLKNNIQSMAAKAFQTHTKLLAAKSEMVRYMAAKDILDRAGYKPTDKVDIDSTDMELNIKVDYGGD